MVQLITIFPERLASRLRCSSTHCLIAGLLSTTTRMMSAVPSEYVHWPHPVGAGAYSELCLVGSAFGMSLLLFSAPPKTRSKSSSELLCAGAADATSVVSGLRGTVISSLDPRCDKRLRSRRLPLS